MMKKRFLVGITAMTLAAGAAFGLGQGSASAAATPSTTTSVTQQRGPGVNDGTRAGGVVASVSGTTISVTGRDGASKAIQTTASTTFTLDGSASSLSAIAAGQFLHADGTTDSAGVFTATAVKASTTPPQGRGGARQEDGTRAGGVVASVSGTTISVTGRDGASKAIQTTASTTFTLDGSASNLSAIAAGQFLHADGTTDSAGVFTATAVKASTTPPQGRHGAPRP